jgi:hypothetical protein
MVNKIDSNSTGLSYAEEETIKTLPVTPVWYPLEPNSYSDFGGQIKTVARNPINSSRQRKKGVTVDLDASGGFNQDLTQTNLTRLLQGFFFADLREKVTNQPMNAAATLVSAVAALTDTYTFGSGALGSSYLVNDIVLASGFGVSANNGLKIVASSTATTVVVGDGLADEAAPPATAELAVVGYQFASGDATITVVGDTVTLVNTTKDLTTLGLIAGEWVYIGGDTAVTQFATAADNGFARIQSIAIHAIVFDKTAGTMVADAGAAKTIQLFKGNVLKNESNPALIKRRSYQLERTLGQDANGTMSEYLVGTVSNQLTLSVKQADKVTADLAFVATDNEQRNGTTGVKTGTRKTLSPETAFNTSSDFSRVKMHQVTTSTNPTALFAFLTEFTLTVNNNISPDKAVAVLGAFDVSAGTFQVSGNVTAYFADVAAVQAVRNNADVSIDFALVKNNAGLVWDLPLLALGDGRLSVEQDKSITLPLSLDAAESLAGHTLLLNEFPYLPTAAG